MLNFKQEAFDYQFKKCFYLTGNKARVTSSVADATSLADGSGSFTQSFPWMWLQEESTESLNPRSKMEEVGQKMAL